MNYLENLLLLDGPELDRYGRSDAGPEFRSARRAVEVRLLTGLLSELENSSVLIAVSTDIATALSRANVRMPRAALATYEPRELSHYSELAERLLTFDCDIALLTLMQTFNARLLLAKSMSRTCIGEKGNAHGSVDVETLADAWQKTCAAALALDDALRQSLADSCLPEPSLPTGDVVGLLQSSCAGECPCIEEDGTIVVPGWAERRSFRRINTALTAVAHHEGGTALAVVSDISAGGLALEGIRNARRGDRLTVEFESGRILSGAVSWSAGAKIGLEFSESLEPDDPLLSTPGSR